MMESLRMENTAQPLNFLANKPKTQPLKRMWH